MLRSEFEMPMLTAKLVDLVRLQMMRRGFATVTTASFFDDALVEQIKTGEILFSTQGKQWWKFPQLARFGCWLERLLRDVLPEESLGLANLEFRHEPAGSQVKDADRLHADGSYLRSVYTLFGPTTIYRDGSTELSVPCGKTLLMTAMDRARAIGMQCTLHRRPGPGPERAVIVGSFERRGAPRQTASEFRRPATRARSWRGRRQG
jgi:hypothetical protein